MLAVFLHVARGVANECVRSDGIYGMATVAAVFIMPLFLDVARPVLLFWGVLKSTGDVCMLRCKIGRIS
jgi:hypothetical protein